jgi:hypothetical protein
MDQNSADLRGMTSNGEESPGELSLSKREMGQVIHNRWVAAGIKNRSEFATKSGIHRDTVKKIEQGTASDAQYERASAWLDRYTGEPKGERVVTFEVEGLYGVGRVSVAGPVEDAAELEERFARILDRLLAGQRPDDPDGGGGT